jgi:hypothetical protein
VIERRPLDDHGSFAWLSGHDDPLVRGSAALVLGDGVLVVDPVDVPGLDPALAAAGRVIGVTSVLDRHRRDSSAIAARLGVPLLVPRAHGGAGLGLPGVEERTVIARRGWHESLLWMPDRRLLYCAETLGTAPFFLASPADRLGMHPLARLVAPRRAFEGLDPRAMAFGHGAPLLESPAEEMRAVLGTARHRMPRHWIRLLPASVRASRAARRARREAA